MTRPARRRAGRRTTALVAVATGLIGVLAPVATAAPAPAAGDRARAMARSAEPQDATPLRVDLETLAPAVVPTRGRLTVTGTVTNRSDRTWTDLNAYLVTSGTPVRTRSELAEAVDSAEDAAIGERLTTDGLFATLGDLAPGASTRYRLSVTRADLRLSGETGVYWVGVHVLGADDAGRDSVADGRARTFVPLLPPAGSPAGVQARTRLALVVPLKARVRRAGATRLLGVAGWERTLGEDGRLRRVLELSGRARGTLTWVVDPAVVDAVESMAAGNPALDTRATVGDGSGDDDQGGADGGGGSPSPSTASEGAGTGSPAADDPSGSASGGDTGGDDSGDASGPEQEPPAAASAATTSARSWLEEFRRQAPTHTVASVPYGNLDVAAVLGGPVGPLYERATELSAASLAVQGVEDALSVVDPPGGSLPAGVLQQLDPGTTVLVDDTALPDADGPVVLRSDGTALVRVDTAAGAGGPGPGAPHGALAFRQRLLADAALHALSEQRDQPLVVSTPSSWNPGPAWSRAGFFTALDQPWLQLVDLSSLRAGAAGQRPGAATGTGDSSRPTYTQEQRAAELPLGNLLATRRLVRAGGVFARLLTANDTVDEVLARTALLGSSTAARRNPGAAQRRTRSTTRFVQSQMDRVHVEGPPFVMMSGASGPIQVTLINDLDRTVTAGLSAQTPGSALVVEKVEPVTLGPGRRTTIRLDVTSGDIGVHSVRLGVTDADGVPLGSETQFSVRTSNVSTVIWVIMGAGAALLFLAIGVRLFRRVRRRRATHGPLLHRDQAAG